MEVQQAQLGRLANGIVLNKVLGFNVIRQIKKIVTSGDINTIGCHDRIIPSPSMIAYRKLGIPKSAAVMIITVLNNTTCRLRTRHILPARTYMTKMIQLILGVGQGSCS